MLASLKRRRVLGYAAGPVSFTIGIVRSGEVAEWLKAHAWKVCIRRKAYRGFESRPLRHSATDRVRNGSAPSPGTHDYIPRPNAFMLADLPMSVTEELTWPIRK